MKRNRVVKWKIRYTEKGLNAVVFRHECHGIHFGRDFNVAAFVTQCRGIQTSTWNLNLAEAWMSRHSLSNVAAFELHKKIKLEVSMPNAAAFTTQCRGIRFTREKIFEVRTFNAAALSTQCRGIQALGLKSKTSMPQHSVTNAAAFVVKPKKIKSPTRVLFTFFLFLFQH